MKDLGKYFVTRTEIVGAFPMTLEVYADSDSRDAYSAESGREDARREPRPPLSPKEEKPIVLYVRNTCMPRVGRESDDTILSDLLKEGYLLTVLDCHHDERAVCPLLDLEIQKIRLALEKGEYLGGLPHVRAASYVLPAGYRLRRGIPYFDLATEGADGCLSRTLEIWNRDLITSSRADMIVKDKNGKSCRLGDLHAATPEDCVKPDGSPLDFLLYLDIIYPSNPEGEVPVMFLASSSENRTSITLKEMRPHFTGFLMRGYAGVIFDYAYVPTARADHYGYHYDWRIPTQDYGLSFYTGIKASAAAVRKVRRLATVYPERYRFRIDAFGGYGHSKSGYVYALANKHPERLPEQFYFEGHRGEAPKGAQQPSLTYPDGSPIPSNLQAVYFSSGAAWSYSYDEENFAPTYLSAGELDGSFTTVYPHIVSTGLQYNIPTSYYSMPNVGHEIIYGKSEALGIDLYSTVFDFFDANLAGGENVLAYLLPKDGTSGLPADFEVRAKFVLPVPKTEIEENVLILNARGEKVAGRWGSSFGDTEWHFHPTECSDGGRYTVTVSKNLRVKDGRSLRDGKQSSFETRKENVLPLTKTADGWSFTVPKSPSPERTVLRFYAESESSSRLRLCLTSGDDRREFPLVACGCGLVTIDISEFVNHNLGQNVSVKIKREDKSGVRTLHVFSFEEDGESIFPHLSYGNFYRVGIHTPKGEDRPALCIETEQGVGDLRKLYSKESYIRWLSMLSDRPLTSEDLGRTFRISFSVMSPEGDAPRYVISGISDDREKADGKIAPVHTEIVDPTWRLIHPTEPNKWYPVSFDYTIDRESYIEKDKRELFLEIDAGRIYLRDLTVSEVFGGVRLRAEGDPDFVDLF